MKRIIFLFLLFISLSIYSQIHKVSNYGNKVVSLSLFSDKTYCLNSTNPYYEDPGDVVDENEIPLPNIIWSEGTYIYSKDTLICRDKDGTRICYFLVKKKQTFLRLFKFIGFGKDTPINRQKIYDEIKKKAYVAWIHKLFLKNPNFYLVSQCFIDKKGQMIPYEVYAIKDGIYQLVYKRDKDEIIKSF